MNNIDDALPLQVMDWFSQASLVGSSSFSGNFRSLKRLLYLEDSHFYLENF